MLSLIKLTPIPHVNPSNIVIPNSFLLIGPIGLSDICGGSVTENPHTEWEI